jgi:hypothetical protein
MLGDEQPETHQVATDLIGQELAYAALEAGGVTGLGFGAVLGAVGFESWFRGGTIAMEFFFEARTAR